MESRPHFSIVSPVYRAEHILDALVDEIRKTMTEMGHTFEIILVDDRSPDHSWTVMKRLSQTFPEVKSVRLSRNFGQHPAIMAGLSQARGEWVVVMDCDLQDQPKEIPKLYAQTSDGFEVVLARRTKRTDGFLKKLSSRLFSVIYSYFTNVRYDNEIANYGVYHRKVIDAVLTVNDYIKFFPLFVKLAGFNTTAVEIEHGHRHEGESTYTLSTLMSLAFNTILSFSSKPLKLFVKFGLVISILSFLAGLYVMYRAITGHIAVLGYTSIIVSIWFLSGIIITTIGVTGVYVGKIFDQTKHRPVFIIDEIW